MEQILKAARLEKAELSEEELDLINQQTLRPLGAEEVFSFRLAACDNQVDRDGERFTQGALAGMAERYVGKPVLTDHSWSAGRQLARVYAAAVETAEGAHRLVLRCYMVRTAQTTPAITAIEGGIRDGSMTDRCATWTWTEWQTPMRSPWWPSLPSRRPESSRASATADRSRPRTMSRRENPEPIARTGGTRPCWSWNITDFDEGG